jgi:DNA repair protein RecN (Recombination protein N)
MLHHLHIQNFTIIDELELEFKTGMTVLTGETGAGKSILIDALLLALGDRADSSVIRTGNERCSISADFDIQQLPAAQQWLNEHELSSDDACVLRRVINNDGRSKGFINGQTVPLQQLRELGNLLINIHGQHEHQTLLKPDKQRALLDAYAGNSIPCKKVQELYNQWRKTQDELETLQTQNTQRAAHVELLTYQVQELDKLALQADELTQLDTEQRQLANVDHLLENAHNAIALLADNEEHNVLTSLNHISQQLITIQNIDSSLANAAELINNVIIQVEEAGNDLRHYLDRVELNPERLQWVEQRLTAIYDIARKHKVDAKNLYDWHQQMRSELDQLENHDAHLLRLQQTITELATAYQKAAAELTKSRQQAAKRLCPLIEKSMQQLGMPHGHFTIQFEKIPDNQFSAYGQEKIEFQVSTNPGLPLQPLAKTASGGELSRISLAIHVLTAQKDATPTLIFDEVDTGIGGGTAEIVGGLLRQLANTAQVLCVTHLPQVAAQGQQHLQVGKIINKTHTKTEVRTLDKKSKIQEIARMLGGVKITDQTLAHAKEMVEGV